MEKIYNKLVRDKIPKIIEKSGKQANFRKLNPEELKKQLDLKLQEELQEYLAARANTQANDREVVAELADMVEVIYAVLQSMGISREEFEKIRQAKADERGGFEQALFLISVSE